MDECCNGKRAKNERKKVRGEGGKERKMGMIKTKAELIYYSPGGGQMK